MPRIAFAAKMGHTAKNSANAHAATAPRSRCSSAAASPSAMRSNATPETRANRSVSFIPNAPSASHAVHSGDENPNTRSPAL